eukprot:COSAG02_NODE_368_length_23727_cov_364.814367_18_plen_409_part_00
MLDPWAFGMIDRDWATLRPVDEQGEPLAEADRVEVMRSWQRLFGGNMLLADGVPVPLSNSDVTRNRERPTSLIGPAQLEYSGRLVVADPPHADRPLRNAADMAGAVALVRRGTAEPACGCGSNGSQFNTKACNRCSFIGKAARLRDAGAVGMILSMDEVETREPVPRSACGHKGTPDTPVAYVEDIYHVAADEFKPWNWWTSDGIDENVQAVFTPSDAPTCYDWFGMETKQQLYYDRQNSKLPATVMVAKADAERLVAADRIQLSLGKGKAEEDVLAAQPFVTEEAFHNALLLYNISLRDQLGRESKGGEVRFIGASGFPAAAWYRAAKKTPGGFAMVNGRKEWHCEVCNSPDGFWKYFTRAGDNSPELVMGYIRQPRKWCLHCVTKEIRDELGACEKADCSNYAHSS